MIKKVMMPAANRNESVLPQNKKKGGMEGKESSPKELFGSLLRSMQGEGKVQKQSSSSGDSKTKGKNESADQQSEEGKVGESVTDGTNATTLTDAVTKVVAVSGKKTDGGQGEPSEDAKQPLIDKLNGSAQKETTKKLNGPVLSQGQVTQGIDRQNVSPEQKATTEASAGKSKILEETKQASKAGKKQGSDVVNLLSNSETTTAGEKVQQGNQEGKEPLPGKAKLSAAQQHVLPQVGPSSKNNGQQIQTAGSEPTDKGEALKVDMAKDDSRSQTIPMNGERISIQNNESESVAAKLVRLKQRLNGAAQKKVNSSSQDGRVAPEAKTTGDRALEEQKKILHSTFAKGKGATPLEKSIAAKGLQAGQAQEKEEKKRLPSFANRELRTEAAGSSGSGQQGRATSPGKFHAFSPLGFNNTHSPSAGDQDVSFDKDKMVWKEYSTESVELKEGKGSEQGRSAQMKLGQASISNISVRRKIMPGLTKSVQQAAAKARQAPETWQKHNFVLDDGKKIHLSARQVEGVLHLKLGSLNSDLNRLLQQYQQQIKEHLKQECGTDIDLQLENNQGQEMSGFFDNDSSSSGQERRGNRPFSNQKVAPQQVNQVLLKSVRDFGYNKMEWTA